MGDAYKRVRLWVNPGFQSQVLLRMALCFLFWILVVLHIAFAFEFMWHSVTVLDFGTGFVAHYVDFWKRFQFILYGCLLCMPPVLADILRFSHRLAGPLYRCRKTILEMAAGKRVSEFRPRPHDLMPELYDALNVLIRECNARIAAQANGGLPYPQRKEKNANGANHILESAGGGANLPPS